MMLRLKKLLAVASAGIKKVRKWGGVKSGRGFGFQEGKLLITSYASGHRPLAFIIIVGDIYFFIAKT